MEADEKQFLEFGSIGSNENFNRDRIYMEEAEEEDLIDRLKIQIKPICLAINTMWWQLWI